MTPDEFGCPIDHEHPNWIWGRRQGHWIPMQISRKGGPEGPPGRDGKPGPAGATGPQGLAGRDFDPAEIQRLKERITSLENRVFTLEGRRAR